VSAVEYELYRYQHPDGRAKEWAYADLGNGVAEIRWGSQGHLRQHQEKPIRVAVERAREKEGKGYVWQGRCVIDSTGCAHPVARQFSPPPAAPLPRPPPPPPPKKTSVDLTALLGEAHEGFYF
jgi:hypothetical protein